MTRSAVTERGLRRLLRGTSKKDERSEAEAGAPAQFVDEALMAAARATGGDGAEPEAAVSDGAQSEAEPEAAKPEAAKPEGAKPEAAKPEGAKPEAAKPDQSARGFVAHPEAAPRDAHPEDARERESAQPGATEPTASARAAQPDARPTLDGERCELIEAGPGQRLLRVVGRWRPAAPASVELLIWTPNSIDSRSALPPGPSTGDDGKWTAAFPVDSIPAQARLILWLGAGVGIELPAPTRAADASRAESPLEDELADALDELEDVRQLADHLRRRCELAERGRLDFKDKLVHAWGEAASLREMLDEREATHARAKERERAAQALFDHFEERVARGDAELEARRAELEHQCAQLQDELSRRSEAGEATEARLAEVQAEAADALARFESARAESARARQDLDAVREEADVARRQAAAALEHVEAAHGEAQAAREQLEAARAEAEAANERAEAARQEAGTAQPQLEAARQDAATARAQLEAARQEAAAAQAQLDAARADAAAARREADAARSEAQGARDDADAVERDDAASRESELAEQARQLRQLQGALLQAGSVEADLRHLLETRDRELAQLRAELGDQRARYANVASQVPTEDPVPPAVAEAGEPWSAVDQDLLDRIARAKQLAGQD